MQHLYAPWRNTYLTKESSTQSCVFCVHSTAEEDAAHFIIKRCSSCFVMLNVFPYNAGHIMVIPYRHVATLTQLNTTERGELMEVSTLAITLIQEILHPDGFNVGLNLGGKAAGGSMPHHLHMHVLPRWHGDTSFLTTLAETKQISTNLIELYQKLHTAFEKHKPLS